MIEGIPSKDVPANLDNIKPFLDGFASRSNGRWSVDSLLHEVMECDKQIWKIGDWQALCLTSVGPNCVNIVACAGVRRKEWQCELDEEIQAWARALGKSRVFAMVRPGWAKFGKQRGYKEVHREMMVEL